MNHKKLKMFLGFGILISWSLAVFTPGEAYAALTTEEPTDAPISSSGDLDLELAPINCGENEWGYDRCKDQLNLLTLFKVDMGVVCSTSMVKHGLAFETYGRGEWDIFDFSYTSSSYSLEYRVHCGGGDYLDFSAYVSHYDWGSEGYGLADFIMGAIQAFGGAHEPYGVSADDMADAWEQDMIEKYEEEKRQREQELQDQFDSEHEGEGADTDEDSDEDTDSSDSDDTDTDTDFYDDGSDWCDQPYVTC